MPLKMIEDNRGCPKTTMTTTELRVLGHYCNEEMRVPWREPVSSYIKWLWNWGQTRAKKLVSTQVPAQQDASLGERMDPLWRPQNPRTRVNHHGHPKVCPAPSKSWNMTPPLKSKWWGIKSQPTHHPLPSANTWLGIPKRMVSSARESAYPVPPIARGHMPHVTQNPNADSNEDMDPTSSQALDNLPLVGKANRPRHTNSTHHRLYQQHSSLSAWPTHQGAGGSVQTRTVLEFCSLFWRCGSRRGWQQISVLSSALSQTKPPSSPFCLPSPC